jgi:hypothetical protein
MALLREVWRKLHDNGIQNFYSTPNTMIKSRRVRWKRCERGKKMPIFWSQNLEE